MVYLPSANEENPYSSDLITPFNKSVIQSKKVSPKSISNSDRKINNEKFIDIKIHKGP